MNKTPLNFDTPLDTPVLFLAFSRPAETAQVFEAIRRAAPTRLFIAQDGPRPGNPDDPARCAEVRSILTDVDWDCEVNTLFRDENLGCGDAVAGAIDWFFDQVEEGIILEDDCVPTLSFFRFCTELLNRYRDDHRVTSICGHCFLENQLNVQESYYFTKFAHVWGWATWKRAWDKYDRHMDTFPRFESEGWINHFIEDEPSRRHWLKYFRHTRLEGIDTWDFQWIYTQLINSGLCATPTTNLITNIGTHEQSTGFGVNPKWHHLPSGEMTELVEPAFVVSNRKADAQLMQLYQFNLRTEDVKPLPSTDASAQAYWFDFGYKLNLLHPDNIDPIPHNARVCIYGYGRTGFGLLERIKARRPDIKFVCWVDTYRDETVDGDRMVRIDNIRSVEFDWVVIASVDYLDDMESRLIEQDVPKYFIYAPFEMCVRKYLQKNMPVLRSTAQYDNNLAMYRALHNAMGIMNWQDPAGSGEAAFLERFLSPLKTPSVLDVGGHHGEYAKLVQRFSPEARIHSFEPNPAAFPILRLAAERRGFSAYNLGCSDGPGEIEIFDYEDDQGSVHASVHKEVFSEIYHRNAVGHTARMVTVDGFAREHGIDRIDLLKIDTEGHEMHVLRGAESMIRAGKVDMIHFEFNEMNALTRVFLKDFMDFLPGYAFHRLLPDGLVKLTEYDPATQEIFSFQNIAAIRSDDKEA